jgi:hypothetical protein
MRTGHPSGRIVVRFRRPVVIAFGLTVFVAGVALTAAIGYGIMWMLMAVWPEAWTH